MPGGLRSTDVKHVAAAVLLLAATNSTAQTLDVRALGQDSWMEGGFGRLDFDDAVATATADIGIDWNPRPWFGAHVHGVARVEP